MFRLVLVFILSFSIQASELTVSWSTEFTGSFDGKEQVRLLLYRDKDGSVIGSYYNTAKLVRHKVSGRTSGSKIVFTEKEGGKELLKFKGELTGDEKPQLKGHVYKGEDKSPASFEYHIKFPARPGNLYSPICADSTKEVEEFAAKVKKNILSGEKKAVAEIIHYPLHTKIAGKNVKIENQEDFIKRFDELFTDDFKKRIKENCFPMNMTTSYKGVWLGFKKELVIQMTRNGDEPFQLRVAEINGQGPSASPK